MKKQVETHCTETKCRNVEIYIYILAQINYQSEILTDFRKTGKRIALINRETM